MTTLTTKRRFQPTRPPAEEGGAPALLPALPTPVPRQPSPLVTPPAAGGLRKISFAKPARKESTKTDYPVFSNPEDPKQAEQVFEIAARIKNRDAQIEALVGAQTTDKAELRMFVAPFYFKVNRGKAEPPSSVSIPSDAGEVLVTFQNRYAKLESEAALAPILGDQLEKWFRQAFSLSISGELLPVDKAQTIVDEIQAVLARHNAMDALDVKEQIKPVKDFHVARHTAFTPEVNLAIEQACPIVAMVKTKGRGAE
jgi:hypothetical protein